MSGPAFDLLLRVLTHVVQDEGIDGEEANALLDPAFQVAMPAYRLCHVCGYEKEAGTPCGLPCV